MRFWIFTLTLIMNVFLLIGDTFNFTNLKPVVLRFLLVISWTLKSVVLLCICYFFFRKSRKLLLIEDEKKLRTLQMWVWGGIGIAYLCLLTFFVVDTQLHNDFITEQGKVDTLQCESFTPILLDVLGLIIFIVMAIIAHMIKKAMTRA